MFVAYLKSSVLTSGYKTNFLSKYCSPENQSKILSKRKGYLEMNLMVDRNIQKNIQMSVHKVLFSGILQVFLLGSVVVYAVPDTIPDQSVIDETGTLTKSSISYIEKSLDKIRESKQTGVYLISIRTLPYGTDVQEYTKELFQKWNLGEKDVLVVLVNKLAKGGIYYGPQVTNLSEEISQSIANETYNFKAKDGQFSSAALDVNNRLVSVLLDKGDPGAPSVIRNNSSSNFKSAKKTEESRSKYIAIIAILLIIAFVVPMVQFFYYVKDE